MGTGGSRVYANGRSASARGCTFLAAPPQAPRLNSPFRDILPSRVRPNGDEDGSPGAARDEKADPVREGRTMQMTDSAPIRVLSVDDHPLLREGIAIIINNQADMLLVSQAASGTEAIQQYRAH